VTAAVSAFLAFALCLAAVVAIGALRTRRRRLTVKKFQRRRKASEPREISGVDVFGWVGTFGVLYTVLHDAFTDQKPSSSERVTDESKAAAFFFTPTSIRREVDAAIQDLREELKEPLEQVVREPLRIYWHWTEYERQISWARREIAVQLETRPPLDYERQLRALAHHLDSVQLAGAELEAVRLRIERARSVAKATIPERGIICEVCGFRCFGPDRNLTSSFSCDACGHVRIRVEP